MPRVQWQEEKIQGASTYPEARNSITCIQTHIKTGRTGRRKEERGKEVKKGEERNEDEDVVKQKEEGINSRERTDRE